MIAFVNDLVVFVGEHPFATGALCGSVGGRILGRIAAAAQIGGYFRN